jgi:hypothetical protein
MHEILTIGDAAVANAAPPEDDCCNRMKKPITGNPV